MLRTILTLALAPALLLAADEYKLGPDSERHEGVPRGTVTKHTWTGKIFSGTVRDYWVYVPAQYNAAKPACVMIFQDGGGMQNEAGRFRVPVVFDNLIHKKEMPVTIGIFINPGVMPALSTEQQNRYHRSLEYDGLGDRYARFLIEEILPEVGKQYNLSPDPNDRAIGGSSSGAIAAFTAAWNRPDAFRRVLSFIGSYTNLRGGDIYPGLIRKSEPKPLRVFLQDGKNDLDIFSGSWYLANVELNAALEFAGYDHTFVVGTEGHNGNHGSAILPDALRWLWRDYPQPIKASAGGKLDRQFVRDIADLSHGWEIASQGHAFTDGPAVDRSGNVFFTDVRENKIFKLDTAGKVTLFKADSGGSGLMFGANDLLYAAQGNKKRIVAIAMDGSETVVAEDVTPNDLAVRKAGGLYFTDTRNSKVMFVDAKGDKRAVAGELSKPNGIRLSPDQSLLFVDDSAGRWVWSFQVQPNGSLAHGMPFHHLESADDSTATSADGMTIDTLGYIYVTTKLGVQICDQPGRVVAILDKPQPGGLTNAVIGGADFSTLYVTAGDKLYKRPIKRKGFFPGDLVKPPTPQL